MEADEQQALPKIIRDELTRVEETRQWIINMAPTVHFAEELIEKFKDLPGTSEWSISIGYGIGSLQGVLLRANALDLRELTVVRRQIREHGFSVPEVDDYGGIGRRSWTYARKDESNLVFSAFVRAPYHADKLEGQKCEYVKVGVTSEPVYELRCDGQKVEEENGDDKQHSG